VLGAFAGCRAKVSAVNAPRTDRSPPYRFPDLSSPLFSVTFLADGLHGWAVGTGGTLRRSGDGGRTWQRMEGVPVRTELHSVAFSADGQRGLAVGYFGTIIRTDDGGKTWEKVRGVPLTLSLRSVALSADGERAWIVGAAGIVLRSEDAGQKWQKVDGLQDDYVLESVAFAADGLHGWAAGEDGLVLFTTDSGVTWQKAAGIAISEYLKSVVFLPDGRHGWAVGDYGAVLESTDGGRNWAKDPVSITDKYLYSVAFSPDGQRGLAGGDEGTLLLTTNGGRTWESVAGVPTSEGIYSVGLAQDGMVGWAVGDYGTLIQSTDGGRTWAKVGGPPTELSLNGVFFLGDNLHGWTVGAHGTLLRTVDGGFTWLTSPVNYPEEDLHAVTFAADGQHGWAVGGGGLILRSGDGGENWKEVAGASRDPVLYSVAFAADGRRGWAVGENGTILSTTDGGQDWQRHLGVPTGNELDSVAFLGDGERGWAVGGDGTFLRTTDGGQKWQKYEGTILTRRTMRSVAFAPDGLHGWAVGDFGDALRTTDGGVTWIWISGNDPGARGSSLAFAADGLRGWGVGNKGIVERTVDAGVIWVPVAAAASEGRLNSVVVSADGQHVWAVGEHGTVLRSSSAEADRRPFDGEISVQLDIVGGSVVPKVSLPGRLSPDPAFGAIGLSGPRATGDLAKGFVRVFAYGQDLKGWSLRELGPGVYTGHVEMFDGWNIISQDFQFGNGPWASFIGFMGWDVAFSQPLQFAKDHSTQNLALLVVLYCGVILGLFALRPYAFVNWHEKAAPLIATLPFPTKATDKVTQLAGLFLITRPRALDAVVRRFAAVALAELEKLPEAAARPRWVAAPLQVEDELYGTSTRPFEKPASMPDDKLYIRGLTELEKHLVRNRWWLSIEGPGGVGKSALAFQLARWFAAPEPESRFDIPQAIPLFIRSTKGGLDEEVLAELRRILELPKLSTQLSGALLGQRRVLALIDGVSEKVTDIEGLELGQLNPAKGAVLTHLAVMTSRRRIQIADVVKVIPSPVDLGSMDAVLNRYLDDVVGAGRFTADQRESIREALKNIMKELSGEGGLPPQIPMVFVKLLIQRADEVLSRDGASAAPFKGEAALPRDLAGLVDAYMASLLEARPERVAEANQARRAAVACVGADGLPKWRPLAAYEAQSLKLEQVEALVTTGLMVKDGGDVGDPRYKFSLDPIADYLAAKELVIEVRDGKMTPEGLKALSSHFGAGSDVPAKILQVARALDVKVG
jgi:photosystem II stability/assembly factor-like uncharacterized protein